MIRPLMYAKNTVPTAKMIDINMLVRPNTHQVVV